MTSEDNNTAVGTAAPEAPNHIEDSTQEQAAAVSVKSNTKESNLEPVSVPEEDTATVIMSESEKEAAVEDGEEGGADADAGTAPSSGNVAAVPQAQAQMERAKKEETASSFSAAAATSGDSETEAQTSEADQPAGLAPSSDDGRAEADDQPAQTTSVEDGTKANTTPLVTEADDATSAPPRAAATPAVSSKPVASSKPATRSSRPPPPPFVYSPDKITLKFLFANRDGLNVVVDCAPSDTVGEVKGQLLSMWPEVLPECSGGDNIRLICMGKGILMPDSRTLSDCQVPSFKTHATPINVSVRPENALTTGGSHSAAKQSSGGGGATQNNNGRGGGAGGDRGTQTTGQGCSCVIL